MRFFCSKDCPDLCGAKVTENNGKYSISGVSEDWQDFAFVCSKLKMFAQREINNGVRSYALNNGEKTFFDSDGDALNAAACLLSRYKDKKILYLRGSGSLAYKMAAWDILMSRFENCHTITGGVCDTTGDTAHEADFGAGINPPAANIKDAETVILFGKNAAVISQHLYAYLKELKKTGTKIIYIDPIRTKTADLAHRYIRINGACDGLLAQALLVTLEYEQGYNPDELREICGISEDDYEYLAESIRSGKTAFIEGFGMQRNANGMNIIRLINRLAVKTGNTDRLYYGHGSKRYWTSAGAKFAHSVHIDEAGKRLAGGEFDLFVNVAANPAMTYPGAKDWARGIKNTPTLVVDTCETRTSENCDLFLKVGGMFSQSDFMASYFFEHKNERGAITAEMSDTDAVEAIGQRMGLKVSFPDVEEKPLPVRQYTDEHVEPLFPETTDKFRMMSASHHAYLNSQILPGMAEPLQVVLINPKDAEKLNAKNGDLLKVSTEEGFYRAAAEITDSVPEKTILSYKNIPMKEGIINDAVPMRLTDSGEGVVYYNVFCDVTKD